VNIGLYYVFAPLIFADSVAESKKTGQKKIGTVRGA
jgi:hypothetical protein